ncbi:MAG TPA: PAS domain-containing sensor histidine kinase [Methanomicrobiales archaeon]|nr:PAS domain-containing sensor histidine kinase [Methanomicrobiales archaeon]
MLSEAFGYLEGIPLPALALDLRCRVIGLNKRFCGLLDLAGNTVMGMDGFGLLDPGDREPVAALFRGLDREGSATLVTSLVGKNGRRTRVQAHWSRLSEATPGGYLGLFEAMPVPSPAISARSPTPGGEETLPGRIDHSKRNQIIHTIIFHDAKNRLGALHGYASLLRESLAGSGFLPYLDKLEEIGSDIERDLGVASILSHLGLIEPRWQNLREVIAKLASREPEGRISLDGIPPSLFCLADPFFPRVFANLFENAGRHGERVTAIRIFTREDGAGLVVSVEDDGIGVLADQKEKIFELGFGRHTGYGLYLAREILSIGGFSIRETGDPGKGARFEIRIPRGRYQLRPACPEEPDPVRIPAA